jgi:hypothetical protein
VNLGKAFEDRRWRIACDAGSAEPIGCRNPVMVFVASRSELVLVDQAAEEIAPRDGEIGTGSRASERPDPVRRVQGERAVRPMSVVMLAVDAEQVVEVATTEDQAAVEAVAA